MLKLSCLWEGIAGGKCSILQTLTLFENSPDLPSGKRVSGKVTTAEGYAINVTSKEMTNCNAPF